MPTFLTFKEGKIADTISGTNVVNRLLSTISQGITYIKEGTKSAAASSQSWVGGDVPRGYQDITDQVDIKGIDLLNCDTEISPGRTVFESSKPSALTSEAEDKGKEKEGSAKADWVESDTDEQLMLYIPFQSSIKIHSLQITSLPPATEDDETPMRPRTLKLFINKSHNIGFEDADDEIPTQSVEIAPQDWDSRSGTAKVELRFVKFQRVTSLVLYFVDGDGNSERIRVDRLRIFGEAGEKRDLGKLEKVGDEAGE